MRSFLIDGYNLMHAAGMAGVSGGRRLRRWDAARTKFLDWLADSLPVKRKLARLVVVFDAQNGVGDSGEQPYRGIWVRYALHQTADDLIEQLLKRDADADQLTIVSNDGRIQEAARRRGSSRWNCEAFMDWLIGGVTEVSGATVNPAAEKPDAAISPEEYAELLAVFGASSKKP